MDITVSKALQVERDRLRERFPLPIDRLPLAYILLDPNVRILDWNCAAEKIFGYSREEALGQVCLDLILPLPVSNQVLEIVHRVWAGDMDAHSINENRTKDGRIITCQWFNTPLTEADGQFAGVIALGQDITEKRRAEQVLEENTARLQALARRLVEVQEEERRHLARELHDQIGQILTSVKFALEAGAAALPEAAGATLSEARSLIADALARVRDLSCDLRPALLDHFGLVPALRWLIDRFTANTGVQVNSYHAGLEARLAPEVETTAYRIVQEALTNVARHAQVREAAVRLWVSDETLEVQVEDQGVGFDPAAVSAQGRSCGLAGMYERVQLLGGRLLIDAAPGSGTHLLAELPLSSHTGGKIEEHFQRLGR